MLRAVGASDPPRSSRGPLRDPSLHAALSARWQSEAAGGGGRGRGERQRGFVRSAGLSAGGAGAVGAGGDWTVCVGRDGDLWATGYNEDGQARPCCGRDLNIVILCGKV